MRNPLPASQAAGRIVEAAESHPGLDLEPLARMIGGSYALMFRMSLTDRRVEEAACHGVDGGYVDRLREAGQEKLLPSWLAQLETGSVFDREAFGSDQQFSRTAFYNHVIRPEGRFHCVIATPLQSRHHSLHLVIGKPSTHVGFDADDRRLFREILPLVGDIVQARADLAEMATAARSAFGIAEAWSYPVLVADPLGIVHYANRSARRLIALGRPLAIDRDGHLKPVVVSDDRLLSQAFSMVLRSGTDQTVTLSPTTRGQALRLTLHRTEGGTAGTAGEHPPVWIVVIAEGYREEATEEHADAVARQHGLTRREAALFASLVGGTPLKAACRELGMSYNTGRSHLRQIFEKTETRRQSDLLRVAMACRG